MPDVNEVDLAFVVDTTGSMAGLIAAAQRHMVETVAAVAQAAAISLRLALVEYRDHPPQDPLVYRCHPFTADLEEARQVIRRLKAGGGGDGPESVLDGMLAACRELTWRPHARRLALLIGDSPPHGTRERGDAFPDGCPCGETIESVSAAAEGAGITVFALGLTPDVTVPFGTLSHLTGGELFTTGRDAAAIQRMQTLLEREFGQVEFDRRLLSAWQQHPAAPVEELAERLDSTRYAVATALVRLRSRDLLETTMAGAVEPVAL